MDPHALTYHEIVADAVVEQLEAGTPESAMNGKTITVDQQTYAGLLEELKVNNWLYWASDAMQPQTDRIPVCITYNVTVYVAADTAKPDTIH